MHKEVNKLFEQIHLRGFKYSSLVDWAVNELVEGRDSDTLRMLAALDKESSKEEILQSFRMVMEDYEVEEPSFNLDKADNHIEYLVNAMNNGYQTAHATLRDLWDLCVESSYDEAYLPYFIISDRLDLLLFENSEAFVEQTDCKSVEDYLKQEINEAFNETD